MKTKKQLKSLVDSNFKSIRIKINNIPCSLYYNEDLGILTTKIVSELNSLIYKSLINNKNEIVEEILNLAYVEQDQLLKLREMVEQKIIENRNYSIANRKEILEYSLNFDWVKILKTDYLSNIKKIIDGQK